MKIDVKDLSGSALIWAVCIALKEAPIITSDGQVTYRSDHGSWVTPRYMDDSEFGALMVSQWVGVERPSKGQAKPLWRAITDMKKPRQSHDYDVFGDEDSDDFASNVLDAALEAYDWYTGQSDEGSPSEAWSELVQ